ncbi:hypothetical protein C1645_830292 [Glomus cerebriforme]|uniref:Uncharacterized protein n=1 Tax=Glomus cerebriforme TaxID=658196 RepID=A0A397SPA6_9GLOM|nr:hypothetical protein C1645_830292 [Glomus cerebriforme]
MLSLRHIHPNGTVDEIDVELKIQEFNYCVVRNRILIDQFLGYELINRTPFGLVFIEETTQQIKTKSLIHLNINREKEFIRLAARRNSNDAEWQQYIFNSLIISTFDGGYAIIFANTTNNNITLLSQGQLFATFIVVKRLRFGGYLLADYTIYGNTWGYSMIDLPKFTDRDHGYFSTNINSTFPKINDSLISSDIKNIIIDFYDKIELSNGNISISNSRESKLSFTSGTQCELDNRGKRVIVKVFDFIFNNSGGDYFIKISTDFVKHSVYKEPLLGISRNVWKFTIMDSTYGFKPAPDYWQELKFRSLTPLSDSAKLKIFWFSCLNIFFEDIPQLIIQILYRHYSVSYSIIPALTLITSAANLSIIIVGRLYQAINHIKE